MKAYDLSSLMQLGLLKNLSIFLVSILILCSYFYWQKILGKNVQTKDILPHDYRRYTSLVSQINIDFFLLKLATLNPLGGDLSTLT